jgi:uncharacterized LabA/DUF88 family protein
MADAAAYQALQHRCEQLEAENMRLKSIDAFHINDIVIDGGYFTYSCREVFERTGVPRPLDESARNVLIMDALRNTIENLQKIYFPNRNPAMSEMYRVHFIHASHRPNGDDLHQRLRAPNAFPFQVSVHLFDYKIQRGYDINTGDEVSIKVERGTDVAIACQLLQSSLTPSISRVFVITGDSDLSPAVDMALHRGVEDFEQGVRIIVIGQEGISVRLQQFQHQISPGRFLRLDDLILRPMVLRNVPGVAVHVAPAPEAVEARRPVARNFSSIVEAIQRNPSLVQAIQCNPLLLLVPPIDPLIVQINVEIVNIVRRRLQLTPHLFMSQVRPIVFARNSPLFIACNVIPTGKYLTRVLSDSGCFRIEQNVGGHKTISLVARQGNAELPVVAFPPALQFQEIEVLFGVEDPPALQGQEIDAWRGVTGPPALQGQEIDTLRGVAGPPALQGQEIDTLRGVAGPPALQGRDIDASPGVADPPIVQGASSILEIVKILEMYIMQHTENDDEFVQLQDVIAWYIQRPGVDRTAITETTFWDNPEVNGSFEFLELPTGTLVRKNVLTAHSVDSENSTYDSADEFADEWYESSGRSKPGRKFYSHHGRNSMHFSKK